MTSPYVAGLRSVALNVPNLKQAEEFYTTTWNLDVAGRTGRAIYLRGTGPAHHLLALHEAERTEVRNVTFNARSPDALHAIAERTPAAGGQILEPVAPVDEPGGGIGLTMRDRDDRIFRFVHGDATHADISSEQQLQQRDRPIRLAHVVLNSHDVTDAQRFFEQVMGFKLSDRTRIMAFLRCNTDHHSVALGDAEQDSLNHIAFMMPDIDAVMRGGGRMKDAGFPIAWGPGRHGRAIIPSTTSSIHLAS